MDIARLTRLFWAGVSVGWLGGVSGLAGCETGRDNEATGGSAGSSGTGGADEGTSGAPGSESSETIFDGSGIWARSSPGLGVRGVFFILEDSVQSGTPVSDGLLHTDLVADSFGDEREAPLSLFTEETAQPCVSGTLAVVTLSDGTDCDPVEHECAWDSIWGGGIGMHLNQPDGASSAPEPWDATAYGVTGFEFTTTGDIGRAALRFKAKDRLHPDEDFCALVGMGRDRRVSLSQLKHRCWEGEGTLSLDVAELTELQWQIVPDARTPHEVTSFCISHVGVF